MTQPAPRLTVADPRPALRVLYQALATTLNRPDMKPRPLLAKEIIPGASEFAVTNLAAPHSSPNRGGSLIRRTYLGWVALHFDLATNPGDGTDEDALITAVLERTGPLLQAHPTPGVRFAGAGDPEADLFINTLPVEQQSGTAVLTLTVNFSLTLDLQVQIQ